MVFQLKIGMTSVEVAKGSRNSSTAKQMKKCALSEGTYLPKEKNHYS
jgi:hypothetical protein